MEQQLLLVTLGVADLAASRRFYSDGLGWVPTLDVDDVVFYQVGHGLLLGLFPLDELGRDAGHPATPGTPVSLAQNFPSIADVDRVFARARAAGATVLKEPQHAAFGGYHAYVADPDGHRWEIAWNPGLVVRADGRVEFVAADA